MCWRHSHIYLITERPECLRAVGPRLRRRCESGDDSWDTGRRSCSAPGREPARTPNMPSGNFSVTFNRLCHSLDFTCCSDYRYVDFPEHLGSSASIQQGDVLWRRHDDRTWKHQHDSTRLRWKIRHKNTKIISVEVYIIWSFFCIVLDLIFY